MLRIGRHLLAAILLVPLALAGSGSLAQETVASEERVLAAARETIKAARYCFLITLDESGQPAAAGQPRARIMDPFDPEPDMKVWLATNRHTRKVPQLRRDPRATLAYYDAAGMGYVTLVGRVRLVEDVKERERRWKEEWRPFYPDGPSGSTYILIEFTPTRIEVMSLRYAVASDPLAWRPAVLVRRKSAWVLEK